MTWRVCLPTTTVSAPSPARFSMSVLSSLSCERSWSKYAICKFVPCVTVPASGASCPSRIFSKVVFPMPFGPIIPTRSPRIIVVEKFRIAGTPFQVCEMFSATSTFAPDFSPSEIVARTFPTEARRAARISRSFFSSRTRPSLRQRRAFTPWRSHASSRASNLSNSALLAAMLALSSSRRVR